MACQSPRKKRRAVHMQSKPRGMKERKRREKAAAATAADKNQSEETNRANDTYTA